MCRCSPSWAFSAARLFHPGSPGQTSLWFKQQHSQHEAKPLSTQQRQVCCWVISLEAAWCHSLKSRLLYVGHQIWLRSDHLAMLWSGETITTISQPVAVGFSYAAAASQSLWLLSNNFSKMIVCLLGVYLCACVCEFGNVYTRAHVSVCVAHMCVCMCKGMCVCVFTVLEEISTRGDQY